MNVWVRLWHEMPTDPKWRVVARKSGRPISEIIAVFTMMLVNASQAEQRGTLDNWNDEDIAAALDMDESSVIAIREAMHGKVLDGHELTGWDRRQPKREDETAAERSKRHRENVTQRHATSREETQCNAEKRTETQISIDKDKEEDTDTETDKDTDKTPQGGTKPRTNLIDKDLTYFLKGAEILNEPLTALDFIDEFRFALRNVEDTIHGRGKFLKACENLARAPDDDRRCVKSVTWLLEDRRKSLTRVVTWAAKTNGHVSVTYDHAPDDWRPEG